MPLEAGYHLPHTATVITAFASSIDGDRDTRDTARQGVYALRHEESACESFLTTVNQPMKHPVCTWVRSLLRGPLCGLTRPGCVCREADESSRLPELCPDASIGKSRTGV
jgi:hypothetical protein